jgi:hypothetical protein
MQDFESTIAIHPTIGEEFVTFNGWFQQADGKPRDGMQPPSSIVVD